MGDLLEDRIRQEDERIMNLQTRKVPSEAVNHPSHYGGDTTYEVIKVLEAWLTPEEFIGFLKGNIIKYTARARSKGGSQDHEKCNWYDNYLKGFLNRLDPEVKRKLFGERS